jgi:hypothetical protein
MAVESPTSYTVAISGPARSRAKAEVALETARIPVLPDDHHAVMDWRSKFPEDADEWITVEHKDVDAVVRAVEDAGWRLRVHYHTPDAPPPSAGDQLGEKLAELESRLHKLEYGVPPIQGGAVESPPWATQAGSFGAEQTRRAAFMWAARTGANNPGIVSGGLASASDCQLTAPGSGMSVNVSTGEALIPGNEGAAQGPYYGRVTSQTNLSISAASVSNPRIDTVCATSADAGYTIPTGGTSGQWTLQVVTGTPTAGATLANLNGAAALPLSSLLLGYVLVPTSATNIITADIANVATAFTFQGIGGPAVRGAVNIPTSQSTSSTTYTTLATPDQVTGIVLPTNGLIAVAYQASWLETVTYAARAAIFIGANQLKVAGVGGTPLTTAAVLGGSSGSIANPLATFPGGLISKAGSAYSGDVTTGQAIGTYVAFVDTPDVEVGGFTESLSPPNNGTVAFLGGWCLIQNLPAGTYTISVQFKTSSGSVSASNRKLWVQTLNFS